MKFHHYYFNMKHLVDIINESNIDRIERKYREFCGVCKVYDPNIDMKNVCVHKTSKNNWAVYVKDGDSCKKLFIASYMMLDDDIIKRNGIEVCNESIDESYKDKLHKYEIMFLRYDPNTQKEFEQGDATEDDLHDSMYEGDIERLRIGAIDNKQAIRKATKELAHIVNKHPEIVAASIYHDSADDGEIVETIFI